MEGDLSYRLLLFVKRILYLPSIAGVTKSSYINISGKIYYFSRFFLKETFRFLYT